MSLLWLFCSNIRQDRCWPSKIKHPQLSQPSIKFIWVLKWMDSWWICHLSDHNKTDVFTVHVSDIYIFNLHILISTNGTFPSTIPSKMTWSLGNCKPHCLCCTLCCAPECTIMQPSRQFARRYRYSRPRMKLVAVSHQTAFDTFYPVYPSILHLFRLSALIHCDINLDARKQKKKPTLSYSTLFSSVRRGDWKGMNTPV